MALYGYLLSCVYIHITGHPCYLPEAELRESKLFFTESVLPYHAQLHSCRKSAYAKTNTDVFKSQTQYIA